jgi:photosystem II stability/assembly factor-like uncharacterized protein
MKKKKRLLILAMIGLTFCSEPLISQETQAYRGTPAEERMASWEEHVRMRDSSPFRGMHWFELGPRFMGGRVETIDAIPGTGTIYVGFGAGNVWKTTNNGLTWKAVFEHESSVTIGDLEISDSHPDTVWVGTGENLMARSSFAGMGVFKSEDGGETWTNMGLHESHHIGRIVIHPQNPDIVYVAVLGHEYTYNPERGIYKTTDGGKTWERSLFINERVAGVDVVMDPEDPDILYASTLERDRKAWNNIGTGEGSGIHKSTDGGKTWQRLSGGLPEGPHIGRIGLDVAPSDPSVVYAWLVNQTPSKVKTKKGEETVRPGPEVYRSADKGETWTRMAMENEKVALHSYGDIRVAPDDPDTIYLLGVNIMISTDAGETFERLEGTIAHLYKHPARALHLDQHELWIDPRDPKRLILGNDGGVYKSRDQGKSWLHLNNIPAGEYYAVSVDMAEPYNIYGGNQDNAAQFGPGDRLPEDGIDDHFQYVWIDLWGGGDSYITLADPTDPDTIYFEQQFGNFQRKNMRTGEITRIRPRLKDEDPPLRYNWMSPFIISHHNPLTVYFGANKLFKSLNRGDTWHNISPDLTTQPGPEKQGNVPYGTITTLSESPLEPGLLYVGTDDGMVWVTRNDGVKWDRINSGLPDKWVSRVEASYAEPGTVYVSLTGYREDDFATYLYGSQDYGQTWTSLSAGLPAEQFNVIREDPTNPDILYAGSDQGGVYVSPDKGSRWMSLCADLPTVAVHDIAVHPRDRELVIATHGRSFFKLDLIPVQEFSTEVELKSPHLFPIRPARLPRSRDYGGDWAFETGRTPVMYYYLTGDQTVNFRIFDKNDTEVKSWSEDGKKGINTTTWDLTPQEQRNRKGVYEPALRLVRPGLYRIEIQVGEVGVSETVEVRAPVQARVGN